MGKHGHRGDKSAHSKKDRRSGMQRASKTPGKVLNSGEFKMETKNLRLLIVDDEEAARYGMRRALETFGGEIAEAASAESARTLMRERDFDLLLLDVNLPGISGLEFLNQIQTESETNKTEAPLIV